MKASRHILPNGSHLAYHSHVPSRPKGGAGIIFLGGYKSDMTGTKATFLEELCRKRNLPFVRFDYTGHGESSGKFEDGTIGQWTEDTLSILDHVADKNRKHILVGSSMGGWVMLLAALKRPERVAGLLGIAAAPDFSEDLIWNILKPEHRKILQEKGVFDMAQDYCPDPACEPDPYPVTLRFIEEAREHLLLKEKSIPITCPVRLLHGMADRDVPYETSITLAKKLVEADVTVTLVKNGGHRMSAPEQLKALEKEISLLVTKFSA